MANSNEFIREIAAPVSTPRDKGLEVTIKVSLYDNGMVNVNGHGWSSKSDVQKALALQGQVAHIVKELILAHEARKADKAGV